MIPTEDVPGLGFWSQGWGAPVGPYKGRISQISHAEQRQLKREGIEARWSVYCSPTLGILATDKLTPQSGSPVADDIFVIAIRVPSIATHHVRLLCDATQVVSYG